VREVSRSLGLDHERERLIAATRDGIGNTRASTAGAVKMTLPERQKRFECEFLDSYLLRRFVLRATRADFAVLRFVDFG